MTPETKKNPESQIETNDTQWLSITNLIKDTSENVNKSFIKWTLQKKLDTPWKKNLYKNIKDMWVYFYETSDRNFFIRNFLQAAILDSLINKEKIKVILNWLKLNLKDDELWIDIKDWKFSLNYSILELKIWKVNDSDFQSKLEIYLEKLFEKVDLTKLELIAPYKKIKDLSSEDNEEKTIVLVSDFDLILQKNWNANNLWDFAFDLRNIKENNRDLSIIIQSDYLEEEKIRDFSKEIQKQDFGFIWESDVKKVLKNEKYSHIPQNIKEFIIKNLKDSTYFNTLEKIINNITKDINFEDKNAYSQVRTRLIKEQNEVLKQSWFEIYYPQENFDINDYIWDKEVLNWLISIKEAIDNWENLNELLQHILISPPWFGKSHLIEKIVPSILWVPVVMWTPSQNTALLWEMEKRIIETYKSMALKWNVIFYFSEASTIPFLQDNSHEVYQTLRWFFQDFIQEIKNNPEKYPNVWFMLATNLEKPLWWAIKDRFIQILLWVSKEKKEQIMTWTQFIKKIEELLITFLKEKWYSWKIKKFNEEILKDKKEILEVFWKLFARDYFDKIYPEIKKWLGNILKKKKNIKEIDLIWIILFEIEKRKQKAQENEKLTKKLEEKTWLKANNFEVINSWENYEIFIK